MGDHARLSPSSAKRWMTCPAAPNREAGLPDNAGPAAEWGTECHELLHRALTFETLPGELLDRDEDPELGTVADFAYQLVTKRVEDYPGPAVLRSEERVDPGSAIGRDDCYGTADVITVSNNSIIASDLKTGVQTQIEATDPQLLLYLLGVVMQYEGRDIDPEKKLITEVIQPRGHHEAGPVRYYETNPRDLFTWADEILAPAAAATDNPNAVGVPTEDGCRYCKAKATCPELQEKSLQAAQAVFSPQPGNERANLAEALVRDPSELGGAELRFVLDHEKLIIGWLNAVKEYGTKILTDGGEIPGYKMVRGRGSRGWTETEGVNVAKILLGSKKQDGRKITRGDVFTESMLSPAQAEAKIKPLVSARVWKKIDGLIVKKEGKPTLAAESDSRQAIPYKAEQVFSPITTDEPIDPSIFD